METRAKLIRYSVVGLLLVIITTSAGIFFINKIRENQREDILAALPGRQENSSLKPVVVSAIERAYQQISTSGDPVGSLRDLARIYQANGLLDEAIQALDLLLNLDPGNPHWPHYLAFILAGYGELEVAIPLWDRTNELAPDYMPALLRKGEALLKLNRTEDAKDTFLRVLIKDPDNPHAFHGLARVEIDENDYESAYVHLNKSMANSDGSVGIQLMVTVLEQLERIPEANAIRGIAKTLESYSDIPDEWMQELMDYCYDPYQLTSGGGFAAYAGDVDRAIELMKRAVLYDPDNATAHYQLATVYKQAGQIEESIESYSKASELNPQLSDAWLKRAQIYLDAGHTEKGDEILTRGITNNPSSPALHLLYGERLFEQNRLDEAARALKRSIELRPQEPDAYIMLARVYLQQNKMVEAKQIVLNSLEAEPANPLGLNMMVVINIMLNDEEGARKWLSEVDLQPRIDSEAKNELIGYFQKAFGNLPD